MLDRSHDGAVAEIGSEKIFAAIELSVTKWIVAIHQPRLDRTSLFAITGGDVDHLLSVLRRYSACGIAGRLTEAEIHTCYEAGRDGFWLHRLLEAEGSIIRSSIQRASKSAGGNARSRPIGLMRRVCCVCLWHGIAASRGSAALCAFPHRKKRISSASTDRGSVSCMSA